MKKLIPPLSAVPIIIWTILLVWIPLLYVLNMSFLEKASTWGVTNVYTLENYMRILSPAYARVVSNSLIVAVFTTLISLIVGYPFAYITAKLPKKIRSWVLTLLIIPFWTSSLMRIYGWIIILRSRGVVDTVLTTLGIIDTPLKLLYNMGAVLLGMVYALIPFMILAIYNSVEKMDWSMVEAARDLGAGRVRAFLTVTLPLTMPGILAGCVLVFIPSMGLFFISDLMGGAKIALLGNVIRNELFTARNFPMGAALSVLMMAVTMIVIWIYRKVSGEKSWEGLM